MEQPLSRHAIVLNGKLTLSGSHHLSPPTFLSLAYSNTYTYDHSTLAHKKDPFPRTACST